MRTSTAPHGSAGTRPGGRIADRAARHAQVLTNLYPRRHRTGIDPRGDNGKPGIQFALRKEKLAALRREPLPPQPRIHPKRECHPMNAVLSPKPEPQELTPEQMTDLRERIRIIIRDDSTYSQARIAREADVSPTTLSQFLGGTYAGNVQNVARAVVKWVNALDARYAAGALPEGPAWVSTPTSEKITATLRYAQMAADIVLIYGGAGIGKSKTIDRYRRTAPNVWHVELSAASGSIMGMLEMIAEAIGVRDYVRSANHIERAILARIKGTGGLLVLDEAQHLTVQALDEARVFNDKGGVGLVLCGNERVYSQMTGGNRAPFLDRLYSRVGKKIYLRRSLVADADKIIAAWGIDDSPCRDAVRAIAGKPGALRVLNKVLKLAATYAKAKGRAISCDEITHAATELGVFDA